MPLRIFLYAGRLCEKHVMMSNYRQYSSSLQPIPRPKCICFYNGTKDEPEEKILRLSDAYEGDGDIEIRVRMLNINYGKNRELMEASKPLLEYAWFVDTVRQKQAVTKNNLDAAVDAAIEEMPEDYVIKPFLLANQAEVKNMFLTEFDEEKFMRQEREEVEAEVNERVATDMLREGDSLPKIMRISLMSEAAIRKLAKTIGIAIL